jgi:hypothetical protein
MTAAGRPALMGVAEQVRQHVDSTVMAGKAKAQPLDANGTPIVDSGIGVSLTAAGTAATAGSTLGIVGASAITRVLTRGSARVTNINATTRDGLNEIIAQGIEQGMGPAELGDAIEQWSGFDEYRSELIARTELGTAYNAAAIETYRDYGTEYVQVLDGDNDEICAPWADIVVPIDDLPDELGHPNCTRDFVPVFSGNEGKAVIKRSSMKVDKAAELLRSIADDEARERSEMVGMVTAFADALRAQASTPINVNYTPPAINVAAPVVNVEAPIVNLPAPAKAKTVKRVRRDADGNIVEITEE